MDLVFGNHSNCSSDFCKRRDNSRKNVDESENNIENQTSQVDILDENDIFGDQLSSKIKVHPSKNKKIPGQHLFSYVPILK